MNAFAWRHFGLLEWRRGYQRFTWLEVVWRFGLALELVNFSNDDDLGRLSLHLHLIWPNIYLQSGTLAQLCPCGVSPRPSTQFFNGTWKKTLIQRIGNLRFSHQKQESRRMSEGG